MSRRAPNPSADRAAQNQQALKTLVKLENNKSCADCKKNKHPRWASWNLGIFICIRCSGIHRGMGTHISRVKSVDLDSWTDEQLQSMLRWGNARANKYWEAKLAPGHVPADAKIENFIRTKYDSKRWVMDGGIPDPATLDVYDEDNVPLNVVKERSQQAQVQAHTQSEPRVGQAASAHQSSISQPSPQPAVHTPKLDIDLFGEGTQTSSSVQPTTAAASTIATRQRVEPSSARPSKPTESLLGFDFFGGGQPNPPSRPSSATSTPASGPSRPDLKQSILSLYSRPSPAAQTPSQMAGTTHVQASIPPHTQSNTSGLDDAFSSLNFTSPSRQSHPSPSRTHALNSQSQSQPAGFPGHASATSARIGNFFNAVPAQAANHTPLRSTMSQSERSPSNGFGDLASSISPALTAPAQTSKSNGLADLLGFSAPPSQFITQTLPRSEPQSNVDTLSSTFNLSAPGRAPHTQPTTYNPPSSSSVGTGGTAINANPWGSNDTWSSPPTTMSPALPQIGSNVKSSSGDWEGWSGQNSNITPSAPQVAADEDFGGWESSTAKSPTAPSIQGKRAPALGGSDDLFSNVWE